MHHLVLFILFFSSALYGATPTNVISQKLQDIKERTSGGISLGYASNLYEKDAYESQAFTNYSLRLDYSLNAQAKTKAVNPNLAGEANLIRLVMSGFKEMNQSQENHLNDGFIAWVNNSFWKNGKVLTIGQQVRGIIPSSKESYKRDERLTGVVVAPSMVLNLTPMGLTGVVFFYQPQVTKNFHKYEQNRTYGNNTEYSFAQIFSLNWSFKDNYYFRNDFIYGSGWSYGGVKRDDSYQWASEVGHTFKSGLNLGLGFSNAGAIRKFENGNDQTIDLFNNKTASVYSELSYFF